MNLSLNPTLKDKEHTSTCVQSTFWNHIQQQQISVFSSLGTCCIKWFLEACNTFYFLSEQKFLNPRTFGKHCLCFTWKETEVQCDKAEIAVGTLGGKMSQFILQVVWVVISSHFDTQLSAHTLVYAACLPETCKATAQDKTTHSVFLNLIL